jgi:hypothetical protein
MSDKSQRDLEYNKRFQDTYIHTSAEPWLPFCPGIEFKLLRTTQETGAWSTLFKCAVGSKFDRHEHLGAGEYVMISGKMEIRGGAQNGGITAYAGDYGYEPNGVIHDHTEFPEETILYFTNNGPIKFIDDNNNTVFVLDWQVLQTMERDAKAKLKTAA